MIVCKYGYFCCKSSTEIEGGEKMFGTLIGIVIGLLLWRLVMVLYFKLDWYFWYKKFRNEEIQFDEDKFMYYFKKIKARR